MPRCLLDCFEENKHEFVFDTFLLHSKDTNGPAKIYISEVLCTDQAVSSPTLYINSLAPGIFSCNFK